MTNAIYKANSSLLYLSIEEIDLLVVSSSDLHGVHWRVVVDQAGILLFLTWKMVAVLSSLTSKEPTYIL